MNPTRTMKFIIHVLDWMGETKPQLNSIDAGRMILASAIQESGLEHRHQIGGPAHGLAQEEPIGAAEALRIDNEVLNTRFLEALGLPQDRDKLHRALEWSEWGMVVSARLKLWPLPDRLPRQHEQDEAWKQYIAAWKPGKPWPHKWEHSWITACQAVRDCDTSGGFWA